MGNSIVFISKPSLITNTLPLVKPDNASSLFHYDICKPPQAELASLIIDLYFSIYPQTAKQKPFDFATQYFCKIETRHPLTENYMLLYKAIKIVIDNYRIMFSELDLTGYTDDINMLFPYPKYEMLLPILKEIFNPAEGITVN
jgi:hypothetical protein